MANNSLYSWRAAMQEKNLKTLERAFYFDRLKDDERIKTMGLPKWDVIKLPYEKFKQNNQQLQEFLSKYSRFHLGIIPKKETVGLSRNFSMNIRSWEDCIKFLQNLATNKTEFHKHPEKYNLKLTEYEPATHGGVIISNSKGIIAETLREFHCKRPTRFRGLLGLCESEIPEVTCKINLTGVGHRTDKTHWLLKVNQKEGERQKQIISQALEYLQLNPDNFNPHFIKGYFEFIRAPKKGIKFWDYKSNPIFSK